MQDVQEIELKVKHLEDILARVQVTNDSLIQELTLEQQKSSKLEEELTSLHRFQGQSASQDTDKLYKELLSTKNGEIAMLQKAHAQQQDELIRLRQSSGSSEHMQRVKVIEQIKYVEVPKVEIHTEMVESAEKINALIVKIKELEHGLADRDQIIAELHARLATLEQQPPKIDVRTVEVESSARITSLMDELNVSSLEKVELQKRIVELEHLSKKQIEYGQGSVSLSSVVVPSEPTEELIEVPRIEWENPDQSKRIPATMVPSSMSPPPSQQSLMPSQQSMKIQQPVRMTPPGQPMMNQMQASRAPGRMVSVGGTPMMQRPGQPTVMQQPRISTQPGQPMMMQQPNATMAQPRQPMMVK